LSHRRIPDLFRPFNGACKSRPFAAPSLNVGERGGKERLVTIFGMALEGISFGTIFRRQ
jgi:hypothetical protein